MIIINKITYNNPVISVSYGKYQKKRLGKVIKGESPIITLTLVEDRIRIRIETTYDRNLFTKLNVGKQVDISDSLSDISYEDKKGWISLVYGYHKCIVERINKKTFNFKLNCIADECNENYTILVNENIDMKLDDEIKNIEEDIE